MFILESNKISCGKVPSIHLDLNAITSVSITATCWLLVVTTCWCKQHMELLDDAITQHCTQASKRTMIQSGNETVYYMLCVLFFYNCTMKAVHSEALQVC